MERSSKKAQCLSTAGNDAEYANACKNEPEGMSATFVSLVSLQAEGIRRLSGSYLYGSCAYLTVPGSTVMPSKVDMSCFSPYTIDSSLSTYMEVPWAGPHQEGFAGLISPSGPSSDTHYVRFGEDRTNGDNSYEAFRRQQTVCSS